MSDQPSAPEPSQEPPPQVAEPPAPGTAPRVRPRARDIGLGAIAFGATLVLLVGLGGVMERDGAGRASPSGAPGTAAPPSDRPSPVASPADGASPPSNASVSPGSTGAAADDPVLVGAGDIGDCASLGDEATATLLDEIDGTVFTTGDNAYERGTVDEFRDCYHPSWGRHRDRTRPAPGNHDWGTPGLAGYRDYFGAAAEGPGGSSWYSYELGTWHVIVLDSECEEVGGCDPSSPQGEWLATDLAANTATCTIAMFHVPRFSSGDEHGNDPDMDAFWRPLFAADVDVIVNGHDHDYERFAPQDPDAREDRQKGIRQFVVGTGGTPLRGFDAPVANSELRSDGFHGVIAFTLYDGSYDWEFIAAGSPFRDRGNARCH